MPKHYRAIADFYDAENAQYRMLQQDVPFFLGLLPKRRLEILELAVGTARAAIPIAQAGHRVVGVDYAQDMLDIATQKRDAIGLGESELKLQRADLLSLNLRRKFDRICIFFNTFLSFVTLGEQDRALQSVRRHLTEKGRFWLDIFNPDLPLLAEAVHKDLDPRLFREPRRGRMVQRLTDIRRGNVPQTQNMIFRYAWLDDRGNEHRHRTEFDLTYIMPRELQILLERNGLKIDEMWGDYDASQLRHNSPRMIVQCRLL
jgi:SAM-dependent methyltransferase